MSRSINLLVLQLVEWHLQLDRSLPAPLNTVGAWLHEAEGALRHEIVVQQAHEITANTVHRALEQHKVSAEPTPLKNIDRSVNKYDVFEFVWSCTSCRMC